MAYLIALGLAALSLMHFFDPIECEDRFSPLLGIAYALMSVYAFYALPELLAAKGM